MKTQFSLFSFSGLFIGAMALVGCDAKEAGAPQCSVSAPELKSFPVQIDQKTGKQTLMLVNNQVFFWKTGDAQANVKRVKEIGNRIDDIEDTLGPTTKALENQMEDADQIRGQEELSLKREHGEDWATLKQWHDTTDTQTTETQNYLSKKTEIENKLLIETDNAKKRKLRKDLMDLKTAYDKKFLDLEKQRTNLIPTLTVFDSVYRTLKKNYSEAESESKSLIQQIKCLVDRYNKPNYFKFTFYADSHIDAMIDSWNLAGDRCEQQGLETTPANNDHGFTEGPQTFTSQEGSIQGVKYTELGGVFEFDVLAQEGAYHFKFARIKYDDKKGRALFQGEVKQTLKNGDVQYGVVKLADQ